MQSLFDVTIGGLVLSELMARQQGQAVEQGGYYRLRAPIKPITLNELASLDQPYEPALRE